MTMKLHFSYWKVVHYKIYILVRVEKSHLPASLFYSM